MKVWIIWYTSTSVEIPHGPPRVRDKTVSVFYLTVQITSPFQLNNLLLKICQRVILWMET